MHRIKPLVVVMVAALLGAIAVFGAFASGAGPRTVATNGPELTVPQANMGMAANFKASPATGKNAIAALPFANIRVNTDQGVEAQNEPFVAVNPSNARHIIVGANNWEAGNGRFEVSAYVSFDGGQTWAASHPYIDRNAGRLNAADPTIAFGQDGKVYFGFVAMTPAQGAVAVSTSLDGGLSWASQSWVTSFTGAADKPAIAQANGRLYVFYQNQSLMSTYSSNGGLNWSTAAAIEAGGRNAAPVVDRAGNVHVFYNTADAIKVVRVGNFTSKITTISNAVALQARPTQYRANIYATAGISSNGTMYVAWADGRSQATGNDILYSRSTNGTSWSAPTRVNTDAGNADQLMPALTVSKDGSVTVAWLDTRNDGARVNYDVYMARSIDGISFSGNSRVSTVSSNPNNDPRMQGQMIGDYFAMGAGEGKVYVVWTDTRDNNENIYLAPVPTVNN
jgi:hypothetical protein